MERAIVVLSFFYGDMCMKVVVSCFVLQFCKFFFYVGRQLTTQSFWEDEREGGCALSSCRLPFVHRFCGGSESAAQQQQLQRTCACAPFSSDPSYQIWCVDHTRNVNRTRSDTSAVPSNVYGHTKRETVGHSVCQHRQQHDVRTYIKYHVVIPSHLSGATVCSISGTAVDIFVHQPSTQTGGGLLNIQNQTLRDFRTGGFFCFTLLWSTF